MKRTTVLVAGVMGMVTAASARVAEAGMSPPLSVTARLGGETDANGGYVPGSYSASETSGTLMATANLTWTSTPATPTTPETTSYSFSGTASGSALDFAYSQGVVVFTLSAPAEIRITWDFANVVGSAATNGPSAAWTITDGANPGQYEYGLEYDSRARTITTTDGVPAIAAWSGSTGFIGYLSAGTWIFAAIVEVDASVVGGFSVQISVPAPGALPLVAAASLIARRGRRR